MGACGGLELPQAGRWELGPWDTQTRMHALSFVLTWSLYVGVPDPQGTDSCVWGNQRFEAISRGNR
jgi:hypothetical protein